jgi:glycosyltransferase involved in cell wall biosynthesis
VVPAYNEELLIEKTLSSIPKYVDKIYVIDDGSTDNTYSLMEKCACADLRIVCIKHEENQGVGGAIITGYKKCLEDNMDISVVLAGDNQMDPGHIPNLLKPLINGGYDYSKGNRLISADYREGMSKWRFLGNALLTFLTKLSSGYWNIMDPQNGYTAITQEALESINLDKVYPWYGYPNDLLVKLNAYGFRVKDVNIPARYGDENSNISYITYIFKVSWLLLCNFLWRLKTKYLVLSFNPLVFFYLFGVILTPTGLIFGLRAIYNKIIHGQSLFVRGVLSLLIFTLGIQFLLFAMLYDIQADRRTNR